MVPRARALPSAASASTSTTTRSTTFGGVGIQNITVLANGNRLNVTIGNTAVGLITTVPITGNRLNLANDTVSVISWDLIPPGVTQTWVPIDPENP